MTGLTKSTRTIMSFIETIQVALKHHGLIPGGSKVIVGVSGGADSVALLRALHQLKIPVTIAHLNHQLRAEESDADEQFVRDLAEELGVRLITKSVDVQRLATDSGVSLEMAARQARHDFFAGFGDAIIVLAHHADDQVETFLLKLARGAGPDGLSGMAFSQTLNDLRIIRPMLELPRCDIIDWLQTNHFPWREDASNQDEAFLRNRVRHTILPLLEQELNPNIRETLRRTMDILRAENEWMDGMIAEGQWPMVGLSLAARRRMLRKWLFENGADGVDFDAVEQILSQMDSGKGSTVFELNDRQRVVVEYGKPRFENVEQAVLPVPSWEVIVEPGTGWRKDHGKGIGILPAEASFDAQKVGGAPITVRCFEPGDRMNPLGMQGSRKLQDIFTDQKIPRARRPSIPLVICRGEIIWIPGYRTARGWEVSGAAGDAVHARIE